MFEEFPAALTRVTIAAFVAGWVVAKVAGYIGRKVRARNEDPRDARIRSLEADVRVAHTAAEKVRSKVDEVAAELADTRKTLTERNEAIAKQERTIDDLRADLKNSVKKTRELREELADRATENVRSEVKLREVETELSIVQASTDLLTTGMLDFTMAEGEEEDVQVFRAGGGLNRS